MQSNLDSSISWLRRHAELALNVGNNDEMPEGKHYRDVINSSESAKCFWGSIIHGNVVIIIYTFHKDVAEHRTQLEAV